MMADGIKICVVDKDEKCVIQFHSTVIPHRGELINFPHFGTFKILNVAYRCSDDQSNNKKNESLMWVELLVDWQNPVKDISDLL